MSQEILMSAGLYVNKSGSPVISSNIQKQLDLTGDEAVSGLLSAGTDGTTQIPLTSLETIGHLLVQNLDTTNYIELGNTSGVGSPVIKIRPGCACLLQPSSTTWYVKANTAACNVFFAAVEV